MSPIIPRSVHECLSIIRRLLLMVVAIFIVLSILTVMLFRWLPVPVSSVMVEREMGALLTGQSLSYQYHWVSYKHISPQLKMAVLASEDQRFPFHHGFDQHQIRQALHAWRAGDAALRGASTISQQTAKNLWLWSSSDWLRKGIEAWFTALIELLWPKQRILEVYLNIAEWGDGIYGAQAAAEYYFHVNANALTLNQSARLASVLPAPLQWNPLHPNERVMRHTNWVEQQIRQLGGVKYLDNMH